MHVVELIQSTKASNIGVCKPSHCDPQMPAPHHGQPSINSTCRLPSTNTQLQNVCPVLSASLQSAIPCVQPNSRHYPYKSRPTQADMDTSQQGTAIGPHATSGWLEWAMCIRTSFQSSKYSCRPWASSDPLILWIGWSDDWSGIQSFKKAWISEKANGSS